MKNIDYHIRTSTRAKRLSLSVSSSKGLEVVVPLNTSQRAIEKFLAANRAWITKHQHLIDASKQPFVLPTSIKLQALDKSWDIIYASVQAKRLSIKTFPEKILLSKSNPSKPLFQKAIKIFLKQVAMEHFPTHLEQLSQKHQLPFEQLTFHVQKTRWGSCSHEKNIALNAALLFMPIETVHYVMIHELCHTQHLNHSKCFWEKVAKYMPDYDQHKKILNQPEQYLPSWLWL